MRTAAVGSASGAVAVSERMRVLRERGECALIPFIVAGDPDLDTTLEAIAVLDAAGADVIEVGVPYSDPLADGPTIQEAAARALEKGVTLEDVLAMLTKLKQRRESGVDGAASEMAPIVMFTYYNPILKMGIDTFCARAKECGASGLLVPDLPIEETGPIR